MVRRTSITILALWLCAMHVFLGGGWTVMYAVPKANAANAPATSELADAVLTVDAGTVVAPMKNEIRGTNIGLWTRNEFHPASSRSERYVNLMKEAGIEMIRFPAGSESDNVYWDRTNSYEWHVGPSPYTRTVKADILDSFMSLVREVGAEPLITVNAKIDNKEMAADMVRYANVEKGYNIKYWEIGNEPEFFQGAYAVTPLQYAVRIREYADAMKAVDPSIVIVGPANSQPMQMTGWTKPVLSALAENNKPVDAISIHWYPLWGGQTNPASSSYATIDNLLAYEGTDYPNSYISWANQFTDTTPSDNLVHYRDQYAPGALIGITELGQVTGGNEGAGIGDTMAGALWMADVLGRLAYHKMDFVTQFLFQGDQAYGLMDINKNVRPAYYLYPMLKRYFGDQMVASSSSDNQNFTIWASKKTGVNNKLYLMVINKNQTQNLNATIHLGGFAPQSAASTWVLNAPAINSTTGAGINNVQVLSNGTLPAIPGNTITGISSSFTRTFPAHSVTMIELTGTETASATPARYLGQYAAGMNERKGPADWPGTAASTPQGWGKIWRTASAQWVVHFPKTGVYDFTIKAYGEGGGPAFQLKLDGQNVPNAAFQPGSSWGEYHGSLGTVQGGTHIVQIHNNSPVALSNVGVAHIDIAGAAPGAFSLKSPANNAALASNSVTLDWTQAVDGKAYAPFGANQYNVVVAANSAFANPIVNTTVETTAHHLSNLQSGTTYYWKVIASNANGSTPSSAVFSFTTPGSPAAPVRYFGAEANNMNEIKGPTAWPGNQTETPDGWGKIWQTGTASWTVNFPVSGNYNFTIKAYGEGTAPSFQVKVDGQIVPNASFTPGSSWANYQGNLGPVTAGTHTVQIHNNSSASHNNIDVAHMDIVLSPS